MIEYRLELLGKLICLELLGAAAPLEGSITPSILKLNQLKRGERMLMFLGAGIGI